MLAAASAATAATPPRPLVGHRVAPQPAPTITHSSDNHHAVRTWKAQQPPVCCVCFDVGAMPGAAGGGGEESTAAACDDVAQLLKPLNGLLVCGAVDCDVAVHPECYGQSVDKHTSLSNWRCDWCRANQHSSIDEARCVLCPNTGGALKRLHDSQAWAHVACALWIPEIQFAEPHRLNGIDIRLVHSSRWDKYCHLCDQTADAGIGACLGCAHDGCTKAFHVSCALKWNLVEDVLINLVESGNKVTGRDNVLVPQLLCQQHCPNHSADKLRLHAWEQWRLQRALIAPVQSELSMISRQFDNVDVVDGVPAEYGGTPRWSASGLQRSFQDMYIVYDNERAAKIREMATEYDALMAERKQLEDEIITVQSGKASMSAQLEQVAEEAALQQKRCNAIQRSLMCVLDHGKTHNWDWSVLGANQSADTVVHNTNSNNKQASVPPADLTASQVTEFFLQFNGDIDKIVPCPLNSIAEVNEPEFVGTLPSLSTHTGALRRGAPSLPAQSRLQLNICGQCHTRLLPQTAPCLPCYRDTLVSCRRCQTARHLTCIEPPLSAPPDGPWQCLDCDLGKALLVGGQEEKSANLTSSQNNNFNSNKKRIRNRKSSTVAVSPALPRASAVGTCSANNRRRNEPKAFVSPPRQPQQQQQPKQNNAVSQRASSMSLDRALQELAAVCGPDPAPPPTLMAMQNDCTASEVAYRAPVFDELQAEDRVQITRCAMWRVVNNIPAGVKVADIVSMIDEGRACNFGQFALAFEGAGSANESTPSCQLAEADSLESLLLAADNNNNNNDMGPSQSSASSMAASATFASDESSNNTAAEVGADAAVDNSQQQHMHVSPAALHPKMPVFDAMVAADDDESDNDLLADDNDQDDDNDDDDAYEDEEQEAYIPTGTSTRRRASVAKTTSVENAVQSPARHSHSNNSASASSKSGMKPERQPTRWDGDLYKPFWTRGYGKAKEGWCGICKPGIWLKTKTSVYWYHMHNFHGISSIAGNFFTPPMKTRVAASTGLREGLCYQCHKWIPIQSDKPVNVEEIYWFKHAQKCHRLPPADDDVFDVELVPGQRASEKEAAAVAGTRTQMEVDE